MEKKRNKKGFTLAELLIVVAIIAVLVAIAIPIFSSQLEKSRESTDLSNVRSAAAEVTTEYLTDNESHSATVTPKQASSTWLIGSSTAVVMTQVSGNESAVTVPVHTASGSGYKISITDSGVLTIN